MTPQLEKTFDLLIESQRELVQLQTRRLHLLERFDGLLYGRRPGKFVVDERNGDEYVIYYVADPYRVFRLSSIEGAEIVEHDPKTPFWEWTDHA